MTTIEDLAVERLGLPRDALAGQVAVVTGAGQGIGREAARALAWLGGKVVIAEISESGRETEGKIRQEGGEALFVRTDVSNPEDVSELRRRTEEAFGPASILINNAILCPVASVLEMDVALWDRVMAVNLRGTFLTCKSTLPGMLSLGRGTIVNMISTEAMPNLSAYIASKQGILGFSQSLASEAGEGGVRVIAFAPGFVDTPGLKSAAEGLAPDMGISAEQFMKLPIHPAYPEAAMPAEHAGAATAYLVVRLADEYHGEQVNGYTVLERAGFIPTASPATTPQGEAEPEAPNVETLPVAHRVEPTEHRAAAHRAASLARELQKVILETEAEFNRLPVFVRPMARNGFKGKSGQSLQDWKFTAERLAGQLERIAQGEAEAGRYLQADLPRLKELLGKLAVYYREVPVETGRFTKDAEVLREVSRIADERVALIGSLVAGLEQYD